MRWDDVLTRRKPADGGFTLIELIISIALLGILLASLVGVLFASMSASTRSRARLDGTRSEQFSAVYFAPDVQGAAAVVTGGPVRCGTGTQVVELRGSSYDPVSLAATTTVVSYVFSTQTVDGVLTGRLERLQCEAASPVPSYPLTPARRVTVARSLAASAPVVACSPSPCGSLSTTVSVLLSRLGPEPGFTLTGTRRSS